MRVQVPQFIFREAKIFGPLSFRQFIYVGIAIAIIFVFYFTWAGKNFLLFILVSALLLVGSFALAVGQVGGKSLPATLANFFFFSFSKKIYLWHKKEVPIKIMSKSARPPLRKEVSETPLLKVAGKSRLSDLSTDIEIKNKK